MMKYITSPKGLSMCAGAVAIFAVTFYNMAHAGGKLLSSDNLLLAATGFGVFAGAYAMGSSPKNAGKILGVMISALVLCELFNFFTSAESTVSSRDERAAPIIAQQQAHDDAVKRLNDLLSGKIASRQIEAAREAIANARTGHETQRVTIARAQFSKAQAAADAEAKNIRCGGECKRLQALADAARKDLMAALAADAADHRKTVADAEAALTAAIASSEAGHAAAIEAAKAEVKANPAPPSAHPLADCLGCAPWALDLLVALLRSLGANGLAAALIAFGARRSDEVDAGQTDYHLPDEAHPDAIRLFRPDGPEGRNNPGNSGSDRPKRPGPSGGLSKEAALSDLMQRLADGRTIPSQDVLASDWNRPKQTVSDWMKGWRRIGIIPTATPAGRCKATVAN